MQLLQLLDSSWVTAYDSWALWRNGWEGDELTVTSSLGCCRKRWGRRKIRLIEGNEKMSLILKKLPVKGILRQVFICLRPRTHSSPLPLTHCIHLFTLGRGGGSWTREKVRPAKTVHKAGSKIPTWPTVSQVYVNSDKHLPRSPFTGQFFLDDDVLVSL